MITPLPYSERRSYQNPHRSESFRGRIRKDLDEIRAEKPGSTEGLITALTQRGYECKTGKNISVCGNGQQRFIRLSSLGAGYSQEDILAGVPAPEKRASKDRPITQKRFGLLVDIQKKLSEGKGKGYENWAKKFNAKQMAEVLLFLQEQKIDSYDDLVSITGDAVQKFHGLTDEIKSCEKRMQEISSLRNHIINYVKTRDIYTEYRKHGYSRKYFEEHREELTLHKAAKEAFSQLGDRRIPKVKELNEEYAELLSRKKAAYADYREAKDNMKKLTLARRNVETFLDIAQNQSQRKETEKQY